MASLLKVFAVSAALSQVRHDSYMNNTLYNLSADLMEPLKTRFTLNN